MFGCGIYAPNVHIALSEDQFNAHNAWIDGW